LDLLEWIPEQDHYAPAPILWPNIRPWTQLAEIRDLLSYDPTAFLKSS
jgi:hypothetical protein